MDNSQLLLGALETVLGKSVKRARNNYAFHCPECNHRKPKLEIDVQTNEKGENPFACWVCGFRGKTVFSLVRQLKLPSEQATNITKYVKKGERSYKPEHTVLELPKEFKSLYKASKNSVIVKKINKYLLKRGISEKEVQKYNIGYCMDGEYAGRVVIPSYDQNNRLNYYIGRTYENEFRKYKNPPGSKDLIMFENLINWNQPIIIVEGVFDALAVKRNVVPILGKTIPNTLIKRILTSPLQDIYIALDKDAFKYAIRFCEKFLNMGKNVFLVKINEEDPSKMGFEKFTTLVQQAEELTFQKLVNYKLLSI